MNLHIHVNGSGLRQYVRMLVSEAILGLEEEELDEFCGVAGAMGGSGGVGLGGHMGGGQLPNVKGKKKRTKKPHKK